MTKRYLERAYKANSNLVTYVSKDIIEIHANIYVC